MTSPQNQVIPSPSYYRVNCMGEKLVNFFESTPETKHMGLRKTQVPGYQPADSDKRISVCVPLWSWHQKICWLPNIWAHPQDFHWSTSPNLVPFKCFQNNNPVCSSQHVARVRDDGCYSSETSEGYQADEGWPCKMCKHQREAVSCLQAWFLPPPFKLGKRSGACLCTSKVLGLPQSMELGTGK